MYQSSSVVPPVATSTKTVIAKADSGASKHYIREEDKNILCDIKNDPHGPTVQLPNDATITSTESGFLPLTSDLSTTAKKAHILPELHSASLISLGQLCDDNCKIFLTKSDLKIYKNNKLLATGTRNKRDGLWDIPLTINNNKLRHRLNVIIIKNKTKQQLANYLHGCCFGPKQKTFIKAIRNGNFISWPGLESAIIDKHLIVPPATAK